MVGKRADVVCRLLYILSYFIRCSEVHETEPHCNEFTVHFDPEGHVFTWSLSVEETNQDFTEFEKSVTVSEQSSAAKTDSGFAEGHDGLSRDNISLFQGEEHMETDSFSCCTKCQMCVKGEDGSACRLLKKAGGFKDAGGMRGDMGGENEDQRTELHRLQECQSLCSSVTILSDDSASTVCDEGCSKGSREERQRTPVPTENHSKEGDETVEESPTQTRGMDSPKGFVDRHRENNVTPRKDRTSKSGVNSSIEDVGIVQCRVINDVQYSPKVEVVVPVGRAATEAGMGTANCQGKCPCGNIAVEEKGSATKTVRGTNFSEIVRTLCRTCLSDSGTFVEKPQEGDTPVRHTSSGTSSSNNNIDKEHCRSRHASGQNDIHTNVALLRGISSVSEASLSSSTITFHSESTVFDQEELPLAM